MSIEDKTTTEPTRYQEKKKGKRNNEIAKSKKPDDAG